MQRIFIDSSVLFAAAYSTSGHSFDLLHMSAQGKIIVVLSDFVIEETRQNLAASNPEKLPLLEKIINAAKIEIIETSKEEVLDACQHITLKDAPILAAAKIAKVNMLVSLDKRHILSHPTLATYVGAAILSPKEAFERIAKD
jgi:predicted nucleic acid-binding protein